MFGKKKEPLVKEPTEKEIFAVRIASEVEQLGQGESLTYKLPEGYWSGFGAFLIAESNTLYPRKGKKYSIYVDKIKDGKPAGEKRRMDQNNNPRNIADWIADCHGYFGPVERYQ